MTPHPRGTLANIRTSLYVIFLETRIIGLHFAADIMGLYLYSVVSGGLRKTYFFLQSAFRPLKVIQCY